LNTICACDPIRCYDLFHNSRYRQSHPPANAESMTAAELSDLRGRNTQLLLKDSEIAARWQFRPEERPA